MIKRYLQEQVKKDLAQKMLFISGPRQVGKTTLAMALMQNEDSYLLKWVHYQRDFLGEEMELRYFRDTDGREVDFCLTNNRKPEMFVECKWGDSATSKHLHYLQKKFPTASYYRVSVD